MACRNQPFSAQRRGSFLIEAIVSLALLGTALVAVTRLASSANALELQSDRRLGAQLAGQNVIERFRALPTDQWTEQASAAIAQEVGSVTGCEIEAIVEPIKATPGFHLQVTVRVDDQVELTVHDWRLETPAAEDVDAESEPGETDSEATE